MEPLKKAAVGLRECRNRRQERAGGLGGLNGVEARVSDGETYAGRSGLGRGVGDVIGASTIPLEGKTGQNAAGGGMACWHERRSLPQWHVLQLK